ncbi:hypothetical protein AVEN_210212-1 [Araneus ventricosus]|uniref:Uncharacterized protein n=1 Tax=Araneus ventricosus TaxID=182803 RepID=A0A4Y2FYI5_ARAVE|nr:hypothetical protein AVEN_210212-1 [Araneus ventricosus]
MLQIAIFVWLNLFVEVLSRKKKRAIHYLNIPSALRLVLHCEDLLIPKPPTDIVMNSDVDEEYTESSDPGPSKSRFHENSNEEYIIFSDSPIHIITSNDLNDFVRDLNLSK